MKRSLSALYHAIPLHYLPSLIETGALYAQSVLTAVSTHRAKEVPHGIAPRQTAFRRDRMLGLHDYVHLSPTSQTPLLRDKTTKGYPHALLIFDGAQVLSLPEVGIVPYNTKAWRTRACFDPVIDLTERNAILERYLNGNRLSSLEILVKYGLPLNHLVRVALIDDTERDMTTEVAGAVRSIADIFVSAAAYFPEAENYRPRNLDRIQQYFDECRKAGRALTPPQIAFD